MPPLSAIFSPWVESVTFSIIIKISSQRIAQRIAQMIGPDDSTKYNKKYIFSEESSDDTVGTEDNTKI